MLDGNVSSAKRSDSEGMPWTNALRRGRFLGITSLETLFHQCELSNTPFSYDKGSNQVFSFRFKQNSYKCSLYCPLINLESSPSPRRNLCSTKLSYVQLKGIMVVTEEEAIDYILSIRQSMFYLNIIQI